MSDASLTLVKGTVDLLLLRTLALGPLHGVAIADRVLQMTRGTFHIKAGSLFPALHRLEHQGWIKGAWTVSDDGRRVKSYALTAAGRRQLDRETAEWRRVVDAMSLVLDAKG
ncbi:MAG TPA: PadR family transcriptional regulator [Vicinamibacterales bacterium]|nr:PadR family transcriptional regulator [Vicinamibacterales bacterium]